MTNSSWIFEALGYVTCLSEPLYILLSSLKLLFKTVLLAQLCGEAEVL